MELFKKLHTLGQRVRDTLSMEQGDGVSEPAPSPADEHAANPGAAAKPRRNLVSEVLDELPAEAPAAADSTPQPEIITLPPRPPKPQPAPQPAPEIIRELPSQLPQFKQPPAPAAAEPLPVIGLAEVQHNLQRDLKRRGQRQPPTTRQPKPARDLPLIDPEEVRASLQQLHGKRYRSPDAVLGSPEPDNASSLAAYYPPDPIPHFAPPLPPEERERAATALFGPNSRFTARSGDEQPDSTPVQQADSTAPAAIASAQDSLPVAPPDAADIPLPPAATLAANPEEHIAPAAPAPLQQPTVYTQTTRSPWRQRQQGNWAVNPPHPLAAPLTPTEQATPPADSPASQPAAAHTAQVAESIAGDAVAVPQPDSTPAAAAAAANPAADSAPWDDTPQQASWQQQPSRSGDMVWHVLQEEEAAEQAEEAAAPPQPEQAAAAPADMVWQVLDDAAQADTLDDDDAAMPPADWTPSAQQLPLMPPPRHIPVVYGDVTLPSLDLLRPPETHKAVQSEDYLIERGILIEEKCAEFKVKVAVVDAYAGPVITRYEVEPAVGVRGSQVVNLSKDLSRALGLASIRMVETIPGKTCMGLELPNPQRQMIRLSEIFGADVFTQTASKLTLALGQDITGAPVVTDLAKAPHLLVAGTTGSGKSVGVNAMILSMLFKATPDEVRFIMIDPKMLELSVYNDIPHLLAPVVTDMKLAANALNWCVGEMEKRYRLMSHLGVRNIAGYNDKVRAAEAAGLRLTNPFTLTPETPEPLTTLPFIVVVVDEFADLMMVAGKKIEELIARLAQKARAAGIHLILATQRPSVDVITGLIKANIPTRVAFQVSSKIDSRTILDQMGAESLLGQGDMLFLPPGTGYPQRVHGAFVTDEEVHAVVEYLKQWGEPDYVEGLLTGESVADDEQTDAKGRAAAGSETDPLYDEAVEIVLRTRKASISSVQRQLRIGYNRAARLIEDMEAAGIVSAMESNGNRTVLVPQRDY